MAGAAGSRALSWPLGALVQSALGSHYLTLFAVREGVRPACGSATEHGIRENKKAGALGEEPPCSQGCTKSVCMTQLHFLAPAEAVLRVRVLWAGSLVGYTLASKRPKFISLCSASWPCVLEPLNQFPHVAKLES